MTPFLRRIKTSNSNSVCEVHGFVSVLYHVTRCLGGSLGTGGGGGGGENALSFPSLHLSVSVCDCDSRERKGEEVCVNTLYYLVVNPPPPQSVASRFEHWLNWHKFSFEGNILIGSFTK